VSAGCEVTRAPAPESTRQLEVIDVRRLVDAPARSPAVWSPDGGALAYSSDRGVVVYTLGRGEQAVAPAEVPTALSWSGPVNALALIDRGTVWTLRPDGSDRRSISLPGTAVDLAWAPGSDRLGVVVRRPVEGETQSELWLVSRDGGFKRMVTRAPAGRAMRDLQWFSGSLYLFYGLTAAGEPVITEAWRVRISYPDRRRISLPAPASAVRLSPSGRYVAAVVGDGIAKGSGRVMVARLDGTGRLTVTPDAGRYTGLAWSPQGDKLAFAEVVDEGHAELWAADVDGSGRLHLFTYAMEYAGPGVDLVMSWSPDGRHLAFGTNTGRLVGPVWLATLQRR